MNNLTSAKATIPKCICGETPYTSCNGLSIIYCTSCGETTGTHVSIYSAIEEWEQMRVEDAA